MNIQKFREGQNVTRSIFISRVRPHLVKFTLNESLLERIENGTLTNEERLEDVVQAISKAYPSAGELPVTAQKQKWTQRRSIRRFALALFIIGVLCVGGLYIVFEEHPYVAKAVRAMGLLATLVSIVGFVLTIPKNNKK